MNSNSLRERLTDGLAQLALVLDEQQQNQMLVFLDLLVKWNKTYNLTAVRDPHEMLGHHLMDSLTVLPQLLGSRVADIGSGAGLPGIPLAISCPERSFLLIDSNRKKTRFIIQAMGHLGLENVSVFQGRAQDYPATPGFDTVVCRALASLPDLIGIGGHLLNDNSVILAQKGLYPVAELAEIPDGWETECHRVTVPFLENKERHIVCMRRGKIAEQTGSS